jgi:hypothetical protein
MCAQWEITFAWLLEASAVGLGWKEEAYEPTGRYKPSGAILPAGFGLPDL